MLAAGATVRTYIATVSLSLLATREFKCDRPVLYLSKIDELWDVPWAGVVVNVVQERIDQGGRRSGYRGGVIHQLKKEN